MTRPHWNGGHELCAGAVLDVTVLPNRAQAAWWAGQGRAVGFVATVLVLILPFSRGERTPEQAARAAQAAIDSLLRA